MSPKSTVPEIKIIGITLSTSYPPTNTSSATFLIYQLPIAITISYIKGIFGSSLLLDNLSKSFGFTKYKRQHSLNAMKEITNTIETILNEAIDINKFCSKYKDSPNTPTVPKITASKKAIPNEPLIIFAIFVILLFISYLHSLKKSMILDLQELYNFYHLWLMYLQH